MKHPRANLMQALLEALETADAEKRAALREALLDYCKTFGRTVRGLPTLPREMFEAIEKGVREQQAASVSGVAPGATQGVRRRIFER